jgi:hypothetical protein
MKGAAFFAKVVMPGFEPLGALVERLCLPSVMHRDLGCRLSAGFVFMVGSTVGRFPAIEAFSNRPVEKASIRPAMAVTDMCTTF